MTHMCKTMMLKSWIIKGSCVLFGALIVLALLESFRREPHKPRISSEVVLPKPHLADTVPYKHVIRTPLFGDFLPEHPTSSDVQKSTLQVKLLGVILDANELNSAAIIEVSQGVERVFHVGETVSEGYVLKRIRRDEVYLMHEGHIEYLFLPEKDITLDVGSSGLHFEK